MDTESLCSALGGECFAIHLERGDQVAFALEVFSRQLALGSFVQCAQRMRLATLEQESGELRVGVAGDVARSKQLIAKQSGFSRLDQRVPGIMGVSSASHSVTQRHRPEIARQLRVPFRNLLTPTDL